MFRRQFLDSGECVLTVILAFTDSDKDGGATVVFEEGIKSTFIGVEAGLRTDPGDRDVSGLV